MDNPETQATMRTRDDTKTEKKKQKNKNKKQHSPH